MRRFLRAWRASWRLDTSGAADESHGVVRLHRALSNPRGRGDAPLPEGFRTRVRDRIESIEPAFVEQPVAWTRLVMGSVTAAAALVLTLFILRPASTVDRPLALEDFVPPHIASRAVTSDLPRVPTVSPTTLAITPRAMLDQSLHMPLFNETRSLAEDTRQAGRMLLARLPF